MKTNTEIPSLEIIYDDDPRVREMAVTEDYALRIVPSSWRWPKWGVALAYWAFMTGMFYLVIAASFALEVGTKPVLIALVLTVITYGLFGYYISNEAATTGLSANLFSKKTAFGYTGSVILSLMYGSILLYYAVFEGTVMAHSLHTIMPGIAVEIWYAVIAAMMIPIVWWGMTILERFNKWTIPLYLIGLLATIIVTYVATDGGYHGWLSYTPEKLPAHVVGPPWLYVFTAYMGVYIFFGFIPDYARFLKKEDVSFGNWVIFGPVFFFITFFVNGVIGIWLALSIGKGHDAGVFIPTVMGIWGTIFIMITQVRINTGNFYGASLGFTNFFTTVFKISIPRKLWVVIVAALMFLLMLTKVLNWLNLALRLQGITMVGWVGCVMPYIWFFKRKLAKETLDMEYRRSHLSHYNVGGLSGLILGTLVGAYLQFFGGAIGSIWAPIATLVVSFGLTTIIGLATNLRDYKDRYAGSTLLKEIENVTEARVQCGKCGFYYLAYDLERCPVMNNKPVCSVCCLKTNACNEICKKNPEPAALSAKT